MISAFFLDNLWVSIGVVVLLSISDSFLTIEGAKLHRFARKHFLGPGSYELEPEHQKDVDALHVISFKFILGIILYVGLLWIVYDSGYTRVFAFVWGLVFLQIAIHRRHFENLFFSITQLARRV